LIDEEGKRIGMVSIEEALKIAEEHDLDLVEVSPQSSPPICKLMDYEKYRYQQLKKEQEQKKKSKQREIKSIRLSLRIEDHDLAVKLRQAEKFLKKGHKVKVFLILKGREMAYAEKGLAIINNFTSSLQPLIKNQEGPKKERNIIQIILNPR